MTKAICEHCNEPIESDPPYSVYPGDPQWRHVKTLYAWCHVTKASPKVTKLYVLEEPVCSDLL